MLAHNLCFSTHVLDAALLGLPGVTYETHRTSEERAHTFVTSTPGVLPQMLRDLLGARRLAKRQMGETSDPAAKALFNARQLALKISCNAVYGFTGAVKRGMYPDLGIADSVTFLGRSMLARTAEMVIGEFPVPCRVIGGDSDSLFINIPDKSLSIQAAFDMAETAAAAVSAQFRQDITLEAEKLALPFVSIAKKRYVAMVHEPGRDGRLCCKGIQAKGVETIRRSSAPLTVAVYEAVLDAVMQKMDPRAAVDGLRERMRELVDGEVQLDQFVLTTEHRLEDSYANPEAMPNVQVARKITARSGGAVVPQSGDRLAYFLAEGPAKSKVSELAEDVDWGRENNIRPNRLHYLERLSKPICSFFEAFSPEVRAEVDAIFLKARTKLTLQRDGMRQLTECGFVVRAGGSRPDGEDDPKGDGLPHSAMPDQSRLNAKKKRARSKCAGRTL